MHTLISESLGCRPPWEKFDHPGWRCWPPVTTNWVGGINLGRQRRANMLIRQTAQKSGVIKYLLHWNSQRETYNLLRASPITKCFRNRRKDKGKPQRTSIRYGMKLCHHGTHNRNGMSTHLWRVRTDPNLPICTRSMCAVYVPLPCNCRLSGEGRS